MRLKSKEIAKPNERIVCKIAPYTGHALDFFQFDAPYLVRLRESDPETEAHFTDYFGRLIRIKAARRVSSWHLVEDVRQETFARVFAILRSDEGVRQAGSLGALVSSICNNVLLETQRKDRRDQPGLVAREGSEPSDAAGDALQNLISDEEARVVRAVLDELPERDRRVLVGVFLEEWSRGKLCAELQVTREYLRVLLHRALENFRDRLSHQAGAFKRPGRLERDH